MLRSFSLGASAIGLAIAASVGIAAPAQGDGQYDDLVAFWTENGVSPKTQADLLVRLENGVLPDSLKGGQEPVKSKTSIVGNETITVYTYADGSVTTGFSEIPRAVRGKPGQPSAYAVTGCAVSSWTGVSYYTNCRVGGNNGTTTLGFYANFTKSYAGYDSIQNYWGVVVQCAPGTCSTPYLNGVKLSENSAGRAYVIYSTQYNAGPWATTTYSLTLFVGKNTYSGVLT